MNHIRPATRRARLSIRGSDVCYVTRIIKRHLQQACNRKAIRFCVGGYADNPRDTSTIAKESPHRRRKIGIDGFPMFLIPSQLRVRTENHFELGDACHAHRPMKRTARRETDKARHIEARQHIARRWCLHFKSKTG